MPAEHTFAFCSAWNRYVPVIVPSRPDRRATPSHVDGRSIICLDYKVRCSGAMCPMFTCLDEYPKDLQDSLPPNAAHA